MNPYNVLRVDPQAPIEEIRFAWQRLSALNHPDRGGSAEDMAEINVAYELLSDPVKRAHYDATGSTSLEKTLDQKIRDQAMLVIKMIISDKGMYDVLATAMSTVQSKLNDLSVQSQGLRAKRDELRRQLSQISTEDAQNVFAMVIEEHLAQITNQIEMNYKEDEIATGVFKLFSRYKKKEDPNQSSFASFITM